MGRGFQPVHDDVGSVAGKKPSDHLLYNLFPRRLVRILGASPGHFEIYSALRFITPLQGNGA
jgi:hypothetical protein